MAALADLFRRAEEVQRRVQRDNAQVLRPRRPSVSERALEIRSFTLEQFPPAARRLARADPKQR